VWCTGGLDKLNKKVITAGTAQAPGTLLLGDISLTPIGPTDGIFASLDLATGAVIAGKNYGGSGANCIFRSVAVVSQTAAVVGAAFINTVDLPGGSVTSLGGNDIAIAVSVWAVGERMSCYL
jgi:hypothetical protein